MRVFAEWKAQVLAASGLDEAALWNRVQISDVIFTDGPSSVRVRIEYVIVMDWARSRGADSVDFGTYPLPSQPTDAEIMQSGQAANQFLPQFQTSQGNLGNYASPDYVGAESANYANAMAKSNADTARKQFLPKLIGGVAGAALGGPMGAAAGSALFGGGAPPINPFQFGRG